VKLTQEESSEIRGWMRAKGVSIDQAARMIDRHRTTLHKKLTGSSEISGVDLIELGEKVYAINKARG